MSLSKEVSYYFQYNSSEYSIMKQFNGYIEILDENFNKTYEIKLDTQLKPSKVLISKQFILILENKKIHIFKKPRTDYEELK